MRPRLDLLGKTFGRLKVISYNHSTKNGTYWKCICECGKEHIAYGRLLKKGECKSCGCLHTDLLRKRNTTHGHNQRGKISRTYRSWAMMLQRCGNQNNPHFSYYGGRWITVCLRWLVFESFLADMGERPENKTLDRINNHRGYFKENCKWSTRKEQSNNVRERNSKVPISVQMYG